MFYNAFQWTRCEMRFGMLSLVDRGNMCYYMGVDPPTGRGSLGMCGQKTISSYSFDRIVLIFGYIVQCTNTKILSSHLFAISILNPNYDVINDVISGFAKVVVQRCGISTIG